MERTFSSRVLRSVKPTPGAEALANVTLAFASSVSASTADMDGGVPKNGREEPRLFM